VMDGDKAVLTPAGAPKTRIMWLPSSSIKIIDTWDVVGLRGTGSHDFAVSDVFVPEMHTTSLADPPHQAGPLYIPRLFHTWVWTATVANALGIARGAMDAFIDMASTKASTSSPTLLRDRPLVQARTAEAEAILSAARVYVRDTVGEVWMRITSGNHDLDAAITQARLAITHGMHEAARAVDLVFHAAGTNAVYARNPLERYFRDIHVTLQHGAALPVHLEAAGKSLLGLRPSDPGW
ncbi:MAG: acyl-CoA dehydrogenase family protein, partial [Burkholderiales bacterium]